MLNIIKNEKIKNHSVIINTKEYDSSVIDVSIIIPMYKSQHVIVKQIQSWKYNNDGFNKEIIYIDDACPNRSFAKVINCWANQSNSPPMKIILNTNNMGYGATCNIASNYASGKYLIFLNADTVTTDNWIKPLIDVLKNNQDAGIVGNLQLKQNKIESAGSEWSWKEGSFLHIGRSIYHGKSIYPMTINSAPKDVLTLRTVEMITGCCFVIKKQLFQDAGKFDIGYKIGYWEDADLCMKVQEMGYKIYFTPYSKIYHEVAHSKSLQHSFKENNKKLFYQKWVNNKKINNFIKCDNAETNKILELMSKKPKSRIVGCVIACNEEEFLEASVDSASSLVTDWVFVVGGNEYAYQSGMCDNKGFPTDNTLDISRTLSQKYGGIVIEPPGRCWKDKVEMRNAYAQHLRSNDWMFMIDADEVYSTDKLQHIIELMKTYDAIIMQFWVFWNNVNTLGTGKWQTYPQERMIRWRKDYHYHGKNHFHVHNSSGKVVHKNVKTWQSDEKMFYHYSWVRPIEKIRQKLEYYKYQAGINNDRYVNDVFLKWRNDPNAIKETHPMGGGGFAAFEGTHPAQVQKLIDEGKLDF